MPLPSIEQQVQQTFTYVKAATSASYLGFTLLSRRETLANSQYMIIDGISPGTDYEAAEANLLLQLESTQSTVSYQDAAHEVMLFPIVAEQVLVASLAIGWDKPAPLIDQVTLHMFADALSIAIQGILAFDRFQFYVQALEYLGGLSIELNVLQTIEEVLIHATHILSALLDVKRYVVFLTKNYEIERVLAEGLSATFLEKFQYADVLEQGKQVPHLNDRAAEILIVDGQGSSKLPHEWQESFAQEAIYACIKVSVRSTNRIYGSFWLLYGYPYIPTQHDLRLAEILVSQVATALENLELNKAIQNHVDNLEERVAKRTTELAIALEQAKDADRLKTQLLNVVSHELRTPLSVIKAQSSTIRAYYDRLPMERQMHYIATIDDEADRLTWMITNMLDMSRLAAGTLVVSPVAINPDHLLTKLLGTLRESFPDQPITLKIVGDLQEVFADSDRVNQVVTNLVENAVKYSPAGKPIEIGARAWADALEIWVEDQGNGLAPEHAAQIFDRFVQIVGSAGRPTRTGVGLGLAICRGLIEGMGGHLWCQSAGLNLGSKFSFTLPWAAEPPAYAPPRPHGTHQLTDSS